MNYYSKNNKKEIVLVALLVAIIGMSLGFAAFSNTLSISSSASVTPNSSDFKVGFSTNPTYFEEGISQMDIKTEVFGGATLDYNAVFVENDSISELNASFSAPGQGITYTFYVHNVGQYDAYLRDVAYTALDNGNYKKCSATTTDETKATDSLVQAACDGIDVTISVGGTSYTFGSNISGHKLSKGAVEEVQVKIEYAAGSPLADGPFKVDISNFKFNYSTVDNEVKLIVFSIDDVIYQAEQGMTLTEWLNSSYNIDNYESSGDFCYKNGDVTAFDDLDAEYINEHNEYATDSKCKS